jgi:hypothetical protein
VGVARGRDTTVVLAQAGAVAFGVNPDGTQREATPDEQTQCGRAAPGEIAEGLRTMLAGMTVERR